MNRVILDNGHGILTKGKRSPVWADGSQLFEWEFNRDIVRRIEKKLTAKGYEVIILVHEITDITLTERIARANAIYSQDHNCFLVSVHANAGKGTGWEAYTSRGETQSDDLADIFYAHAKATLSGWRIRTDYADGDIDKEADFAIIKHTNFPAILTENLFMDTEEDCRFLMREHGREKIANLHVSAIIEIFQQNP